MLKKLFLFSLLVFLTACSTGPRLVNTQILAQKGELKTGELSFETRKGTVFSTTTGEKTSSVVQLH